MTLANSALLVLKYTLPARVHISPGVLHLASLPITPHNTKTRLARGAASWMLDGGDYLSDVVRGGKDVSGSGK